MKKSTLNYLLSSLFVFSFHVFPLRKCVQSETQGCTFKLTVLHMFQLLWLRWLKSSVLLNRPLEFNNWLWRRHKTCVFPTGNRHSNNSKFLFRRALKHLKRHTLLRVNSRLAISERFSEVFFNSTSPRSRGQSWYYTGPAWALGNGADSLSRKFRVQVPVNTT
jgi:hypothetical protein